MYTAGLNTQDEGTDIPVFTSHYDAREWFKKKYGQSFQMVDSETIDGRKCFIYYLVLDKETFWKGQKELAEVGTVEHALKYLGSFQPIHILEDGTFFIAE